VNGCVYFVPHLAIKEEPIVRRLVSLFDPLAYRVALLLTLAQRPFTERVTATAAIRLTVRANRFVNSRKSGSH
jgi:hypothetical protein